MKKLMKLLVLLSVNMVCAQKVRVIPSLQELCIKCAMKHDLLLKKQFNKEIVGQAIIGAQDYDFKQLKTLYMVTENVSLGQRQQCVQKFLQQNAIALCTEFKTDSLVKNSMPLLLEKDIIELSSNKIKNFIEQDLEIDNVKKEALKVRTFNAQECLWLFSFYTSTLAFADTVSLDVCDDALKNNQVYFDTDIKEVLLAQSKKLQRIQPKYMWDLTKLGKKVMQQRVVQSY